MPKGRILAVDDQRYFRELIEGLLQEEGYEVRASGTFLTSRDWLEGRKVREAVLVREKVHTATRALMREIGVEIVGR